MDFSALIFALGLLMAGIWLILNISGDFREKKRMTEAVPDAPRRKSPAVRQAAKGLRQRAESRPRAPQPSLAPRIARPNASLAGVEAGATVDQFQNLDAAFVRATFEKFTRER